MPLRLALFALLLLPSLLQAAPAYHWTKLEGCTLAEKKWRDGDSFHVLHQGKEYIFRLYFVDAPEDENRFPARIADQAAYFGISAKQTLQLGREASDFATGALSAKPFIVWTLWQDALGTSKSPRYYAMVVVNKSWLSSLLVREGLARIYGKRIQLPTGDDSRLYLEKLKHFEKEAIRDRKGAWGMKEKHPLS